MSLLTNIRGWFRNMLFPQAVAEREFGVSPAVSPKMEQNISLWYAMFIGNPPWQFLLTPLREGRRQFSTSPS